MKNDSMNVIVTPAPCTAERMARLLALLKRIADRADAEHKGVSGERPTTKINGS